MIMDGTPMARMRPMSFQSGRKPRRCRQTSGFFAVVEDHGQNKRHDLAEHRGHGCTGDLHARQAEQAEDENGVKNDVQDRAGALRDEGMDCAAVDCSRRSKMISPKMPNEAIVMMRI